MKIDLNTENKILEQCRTSVLQVLIFIPSMSHAAAKLFNAFWRPAKLNHLRKAIN